MGHGALLEPNWTRIAPPRAQVPADSVCCLGSHIYDRRQTLAPLTDSTVRLDKWLWAARFFKTRSLATEAVAGGKVDVNGERAKPAKAVKAGDRIRLRAAPYEHILIVRALGERRGPAAAALALYEETAESIAARERLAAQLRVAPPAFVFEDKGRPTKKDRRDLARFIDRRRR